MRRAREHELRKEKSMSPSIHGFHCYLQKTQKNNMPSINTATKNICALPIHPPYIQNIKPLPNNNPILKANFDLHMRGPECTGTNMSNLCYE